MCTNNKKILTSTNECQHVDGSSHVLSAFAWHIVPQQSTFPRLHIHYYDDGFSFFFINMRHELLDSVDSIALGWGTLTWLHYKKRTGFVTLQQSLPNLGKKVFSS